MTPKEKPWLLMEGNSQTGPFTYAQLQQRYANREINGDNICFPDTLFGASSWHPLRHYFPEFDRTKPQDNGKDTGPTNGSKPSAHFHCLNCKVELRVPLQSGSCRCPQCKASYVIREVQTTPSVFLIVPQAPASSSSASPPPPHRKQVPPAVKSALATLGLDESSDLQLARQAYRKVIQSYHPDKVAHLGPELKHVAEAKTKELNAAISTIEAFFNSQ